jgi:hypothetical protein
MRPDTVGAGLPICVKKEICFYDKYTDIFEVVSNNNEGKDEEP